MKRQLTNTILLFTLTFITTSVFADDKSYSGIMAVPTYYNAADMYDVWGEIYNNSSNRTLNVMLPLVKDKVRGRVAKGYVAVRDRHPSRNAWCAFVSISRGNSGQVSYYQSAGVYSKNASARPQRLKFNNLKKQPYEIQTNHFLLQLPPRYVGRMSGLTSYYAKE